MKNVILGLALISTAAMSANALACQQEAQFIGKVKSYNVQQRSESTQECFFEIEYSMFNSSMVCPLDIDETYSEVFQDISCSLKNGDPVSGYLIKLPTDKIVIE